ncbi:MAG: ATP-binding protein [Pseudomonadota bacterium]
MKLILPVIRHDDSGFQALVTLESETKSCLLDKIDIDMGKTSWFDAEMCAAFGSILYRLGERLNTISLTNIRPNVEEILLKNGFLSHYGRKQIPDRWGTTIPYQRFDVKDDRYFADYIERELIHRAEMPTMSQGLLKKFRESIFEIFSNAVLHSHTKLGIFSCGQFFPKRNRLDFSVADLGVGIRQNIKVNTGLNLSAEAAIHWATEGRNTTKRVDGCQVDWDSSCSVSSSI